MELFFSPFACSFSSRIALYEANADVKWSEIDRKTKRTEDGRDFLAINPLGLVPTLLTADGDVITENSAILQYIAESYPDARLVPADRLGRTQLRRWLSFIGTELHKGLYAPLLDPNAPEAVRSYALSKAPSRLAVIADALSQRDHLLGAFSVADAYLLAVLNWSMVTPVDLTAWPAITAYQARLQERPSVAKAFGHELELYQRSQAR